MPTKSYFLSFRIKNFPALLGAGIFFVAIASSAATNDAKISRLINQGLLQEAQNTLNAGNPSTADRLFFEARVLKAQGNLESAARTFRKTLQDNPNHLNAQRELAHTLMLLEYYNDAEEHFQNLLNVDHSEHMRDGYRHFLRVIDQNRPVRVSGHFSVLPSTNINRGTNNTIFDTDIGRFIINPESQKESGVGVQYGLSGHFRYLLAPKKRLSFNWSSSHKSYEEKLFDSSANSIAVTYEQLEKKGDWFLSPYYRHIDREDNADSRAVGLKAGFSYRLNKKNKGVFSTLYEDARFPYQDHKNGKFNFLSVGINHHATPSFLLSGGIAVERNAPTLDHLKYTGQKVFSSIGKKWQGGLRTTLGVELGKRSFFGMYPLTNIKRNDHFYKVSMAAEYSKFEIQGFIPYLSCSYTNNHSNVPFYEYDAIDCQLAVSKSF